MKTIFLTLAMFGAVLGLSVLAMQFTVYRQEHSVAGMEAKRRLEQAIKARAQLDTRVAALSADRCETPVRALLAFNKLQPINRYRDIPPALAADIALCIKRDIMGLHFQDQLSDSKLMRFFA